MSTEAERGNIVTTTTPEEKTVPPDTEWAKYICRIGQGHATCRYLTMGINGWSCEKLTPLAGVLDTRVNTMTAQADNCEGRGSA